MRETYSALDGITVVEFAGIGPAPFACGVLADLGADVVRIERPSAHGSLPQGMDRIGVRDRLVVRLDLKDPTDADMARTLIASADVLVEGFRPGVAERLGFGPDDLMEGHPGLIFARLTGWGQRGPYAAMAGHDINYIGLTGVLDAIGGDDPVPPLNLVGDYGGGGMLAAVGILAALVERERTDRGQVLDIAMVDGASTLLGPIRDLLNIGMWRNRRAANLLDGGAPFYRTYATSDGGFMAVGALEEPFYRQLLEGLGIEHDELPDRMDTTQWAPIAAAFAERFASATRAHWTAVFDGTDACVTPVLAMHEVGDHPHNAERRLLVTDAAGSVAAPAPRMQHPVSRSRRDVSVSDTLVTLGLSPDQVAGLERGGNARRV